MTISIQVVGLEKVQKMLVNASKNKIMKADEAVGKAAFFLQSEVQESIAGHRAEPTSVDTGTFLRSIKAVHNQLLQASVYTNVEYAKYLEYGTIYIQPRPHFRDSLLRNHLEIVNFIKNAIKS